MADLAELERAYLDALARIEEAEKNRVALSFTLAPLTGRPPYPTPFQVDAEDECATAWEAYIRARDAYWAARRANDPT